MCNYSFQYAEVVSSQFWKFDSFIKSTNVLISQKLIYVL